MTSHSRKTRPFKSAEKPVSLYPLSYKQAVEALLQVGPVKADGPINRTEDESSATES